MKALHLDVMDGHFVPNITYGIPIVEAVRRVTELPIEAHLMISDPARYAGQFFVGRRRRHYLSYRGDCRSPSAIG